MKPSKPVQAFDPHAVVERIGACSLSGDAHTDQPGWMRVSDVLDHFCGRFNVESEAEYCAKKFGKTKEHYLTEWDSLARQGTAVSDAMDNYYRHGIVDSDYLGYYLATDAIIDHLPGERLTERRVAHADLQLQGRADLIVLDGFTVSVFDFKRAKQGGSHGELGQSPSAAIPTEPYWRSENAGMRMNMRYPLQHLNASKRNRYALQISLYAYLLKLQGYEVAETAILLMRGRGKVERIDVPFLEEEAHNALCWRACQLHNVELFGHINNL